MAGRIRLQMFTLLAAVALAAGCGNDKSPGPAVGGATAPADPGPSIPRAATDSADAAVLAVVEGLRQNRLDAFWEFLPASHQKDLNDLVHRFAERMDAELWNKSVVILRKLARVLKEKNTYLVDFWSRQNPGGDPAPFAAEMTAIADLLETLLASDLADLARLKTADGGKFLAGTGHRLLDQLQATGRNPFAELGNIADLKVTLVSSDKDSATLTLHRPDGVAIDHDFVRVEGKWIPRSIFDNWYEMMMQANAWLALLSPENLAADKPEIMALLSEIDEVLGQLSAAKSNEQFLSALQQAEETQKKFRPLVARLAGLAPEEAPDEALDLVTVVVKGGLDEIAQDEIRDRLKESVDKGRGPETEMTGDDETTIYRIGPVADVDAFAKRLDFLKVTRVDAKGRIILAAPKE